jgi:dipeptidyl aminopeptidase/acylaminoacyl peptidase
MALITARYGSWKSPVASELLASSVIQLSDPVFDGDDEYWVEGRPQEDGRCVIVKRTADGETTDVLPEGFSSRTLVHEYGGLCYAVRDSVVFFSNYDDQRMYRIDPGAVPTAISEEPPTANAWRYANPIVTRDGAHLICIRERHVDDEVINDLVLLSSEGVGLPQILAEGHDFFGAPALAKDCGRLAWITWDHPQMPWDGSELHEATLNQALRVTSERVVCGGPHESVVQPRYGDNGMLYYVSDRSGWWNLYVDTPDGTRALAARDAEFASVPWLFGASTYDVCDDGSLVVTWSEDGSSRLGVISSDGQLTNVPTDWTVIMAVKSHDGLVVALAGSSVEPLSVVEIQIASGRSSVVRASQVKSIDSNYLSVPQPIEFPTDNNLSAYAFYYPPTNRDYTGPDSESPPLIVSCHGGPTGSCSPLFDYWTQYWTSRGFAVVDVNYGGSGGFGRTYRDRLKGAWGVVDVNDCVNAARYLAETDRADEKRFIIHGGSAGGFTTMCAVTFTDAFAAGASYYGISDLGAWGADTHKFESRYLDGLVGPWPEREDLYFERSPYFHSDQMRTPIILFQGLDDKVVPPAQTQKMADALRRTDVPYAQVTFEGEQHGFRRAKSIIRRAEAELYFYGRVLGFEPADVIEPVSIENAQFLT